MSAPDAAARPGSTTTHGWAGSPAIRIALQAPVGDHSGVGVVICPPFGQDGVVAYRALRHLADELVDRGIVSVRYDPSGRGDSAPDADADAPVTSAETAAATLRDAGCTTIVFAGLSSGALVAATAARRTPGAGVVLWDPPASGRAWMRRQRALATMSIGSDRHVDGLESLVGIDLTAEAAAAIAAMTIAVDDDVPALVLTRPGMPAPAGLSGASVDHRTTEGTAELLDGTSMRARIPATTVTTIADWIAGTVPAGAAAHAAASGTSATAPVTRVLTVRSGDDAVIDRIVALGPHRLFGIETAPADLDDDAVRALPVVLLHNGAAEHRVGAADYQVALARALAGDGVRVVRFDRQRTGESSPVHPDELTLLFTQEWVDDQEAVVAELGVAGEDLAIAGMCSGAWLAGRAARTAPRLVVEISPNDYRRQPAAPGSYSDAARDVEDISAARRWVRDRWNRWVPARIRLRLVRTRQSGDVASHLRPLVRAGARSVLVVSPLDAALFDQLGGRDALATLGGDVEVVRVADGDHSLFAPRMRARVIAEVRRSVTDTFGLSSSAPEQTAVLHH